jgi:hypothetical protein
MPKAKGTMFIGLKSNMDAAGRPPIKTRFSGVMFKTHGVTP